MFIYRVWGDTICMQILSVIQQFVLSSITRITRLPGWYFGGLKSCETWLPHHIYKERKKYFTFSHFHIRHPHSRSPLTSNSQYYKPKNSKSPQLYVTRAISLLFPSRSKIAMILVYLFPSQIHIASIILVEFILFLLSGRITQPLPIVPLDIASMQRHMLQFALPVQLQFCWLCKKACINQYKFPSPSQDLRSKTSLYNHRLFNLPSSRKRAK